MHPRFFDVISNFDVKLAVLLACEPLTFGKLPIAMPKAGVYLFTEKGRHLYVGRSNRLRERYFLHCRHGSRQNQASFAYKLAREELGLGGVSYTSAGSRASLAASEPFARTFAAAKARIREMEYRFVEESDQPRQALLEAYGAIVFKTPYNDFDTH